jgi:hypothetical protein
MTSPHSIKYPEPTDWQLFEKLSRALLSEIYSRQFQRWGRGGQRQDGIDAYMLEKDGTAIAFQCKGRSAGKLNVLTASDVDKAIESIATFKYQIDEFIILTTAMDDVVLHQKVAEISAKRIEEGNCRVSVWGWNTICDHIGEHERIQRDFFGHWFQRTSNKQWFARIAAFGLVSALSIAGTTQYLEGKRLAAMRKGNSVTDLQQFVKLTDDLSNEYENCDAVLLKNTFTYAVDLRHSCTEPIANRLTVIEKQIEKVGALLDAEAWGEINTHSKLMFNDYRQALVAADLTQNFEDQVIEDFKEFCHKNIPHPPLAVRQERAYKAGRDAVDAQLHFYFLLRDFILPGLQSMKARALIKARQLAGEDLPRSLVEKANELSRILQERKSYRPLNTKDPFTTSAVKAMTSRDFQDTSDGENPVEKERWRAVYASAPLRIFSGRQNDIEELIECGVFKPEARKLALMKSN